MNEEKCKYPSLVHCNNCSNRDGCPDSIKREIKPCKICGNKADKKLDFVFYNDDEHNEYSIGCSHCDIWFGNEDEYKSIDEWNEQN